MVNGFFFYENKNIDEIGSYYIDVKDGLWGRFYSDGKLKQEEKYDKGKLISISEYYLDNGKIADKGNFENGNGDVFDYYEDGKVFSIKKYNNGFLNGKSVFYHLNGKIAEVGNYENNIRVGIWKKYNKRGLEISQDSYDK